MLQLRAVDRHTTLTCNNPHPHSTKYTPRTDLDQPASHTNDTALHAKHATGTHGTSPFV